MMDIPGEVIIPKTPDYIVTKQPNSTTPMPKTSFGIKSAKNSKEYDNSIPELEALRYRDEVIVKQIKPHCLESRFQIFSSEFLTFQLPHTSSNGLL